MMNRIKSILTLNLREYIIKNCTVNILNLYSIECSLDLKNLAIVSQSISIKVKETELQKASIIKCQDSNLSFRKGRTTLAETFRNYSAYSKVTLS